MQNTAAKKIRNACVWKNGAGSSSCSHWKYAGADCSAAFSASFTAGAAALANRVSDMAGTVLGRVCSRRDYSDTRKTGSTPGAAGKKERIWRAGGRQAPGA